MLIALLLDQAIAGPVLARPDRQRSSASCPAPTDSGDVVVCARDNDSFRLKALPPRLDEPALPQAAVKIGNTRLSAEAQAAGLPGGIPVNRAMLRLRIPLGGKKKRVDP